MKICVLQPDYSTSAVDYQYYDPARNLSALLPDVEFHHVLLNKLTTYKQLLQLSKQGFDCFVNLCEGYLEWEVPSIDVIYTLELLNLPFTGPNSLLYDPPKELMKYVAYTEGVATANYALIDTTDNLEEQIKHLNFPLFVKPAKAGDSLGIDEHSVCATIDELYQKAVTVLLDYPQLLVEEYIAGREFTVLVAADAKDEKKCRVFQPIEFIFPEGRTFKTYALKTSELHPESNIPVTDASIKQQLTEAAQRIFRSFGGVGYARMDFRMNDAGKLFFLEVNFTCSVFYTDGYEGSADYIIKADGIGQTGFLKHIIEEGIARHKRRQKKYVMKGNSIAGFGIYATTHITEGDIIFKGEERPQRIVTKRWVDENWLPEEKLLFKHYAVPLSTEVYVLWDNNPSEWAPQNHSCRPNTAYNGLNLVALHPILPGQELTLDYAELLNESAETFDCQCGTPDCRKIISGAKGNSVTQKEQINRPH
ncbi:SET domain-containing protein-lysine N-methyltransferase [Lacibacter luteus]|uniref:SET domain-containing protein-lysine N-methyltransferase n=1 Tax=Lacibacter luteus TaxID=2508719 RepID=A0A4Q1CN37_9BACT|nr:SET domain-containing protein-lysine N-methyltransferase [Lacibacter luteus]RXK62214.1 SET domain-containing protein-lysine N-methyltransferase [Lacibacter luteus]